MEEEEVGCLMAPARHADYRIRANTLEVLPQLVCAGDERIILFLISALGGSQEQGGEREGGREERCK